MARDLQKEKQRLINAWRGMLDAGTMAPSALPSRHEPRGKEAPLSADTAAEQPREPQPKPVPEPEPVPEPRATPEPEQVPVEQPARAARPPIVLEAGTARRRRRPSAVPIAIMVIFALAAIAGVLVAAGVFSDDDESGSSAPAKTPAPKRTTARDPDTAARVASWPRGRDAYGVIIFVSTSDRAGARRQARRAARLGFRSGVVRSDDFSSLDPGVLVTFAGISESRAAARRAATRARRVGLARAPYVRFFDSR